MTRTMPRTVHSNSRCFHAYHDESCYMPVHLYEGGTGKLITAISATRSQNPWPRGPRRFSSAFWIIYSWPGRRCRSLCVVTRTSAPRRCTTLCDAYDVDFILGQANNKKLKALGAPLMEQAAAPGPTDRRAGAALYQLRLSGR